MSIIVSVAILDTISNQKSKLYNLYIKYCYITLDRCIKIDSPVINKYSIIMIINSNVTTYWEEKRILVFNRFDSEVKSTVDAFYQVPHVVTCIAI